jgi:hypothetical protein
MDYRRQTRYGNISSVNLQTAQNKKLLAFLAGDTRALCEPCEFFPASCRTSAAGRAGAVPLPILRRDGSVLEVAR